MSRLRAGLLLAVVALVVVAGVLWSLLGSGGESASPSREAGVWLAGPGDTVRPVLDHLAQLEGTPLGRVAAAARAQAEGCDEVFASMDGSAERPGLEAFFDDIGCRDGSDVLPDFAVQEAENPGEAVIALAWLARSAASPGGGHLVARLVEAEGNVEALIEVIAAGGASNPLLSADRAPGAAVLDPRGTLLHTRVVADRGLDLGAWMGSPGGEAGGEGQERHVFNLRKEDFAGLLLGDTWELAVYMPEEGDPLPAMALAVEVTSRRLVVKAMDELLAQGEAVWSWGRAAPVQVAAAEGRCLDDLRLLPDFTPCYALDAERLYLAWDRRSLARALADVAALTQPPPTDDQRSWLRLELERFPLAEERLARASGDDEVTAFHWPWRRLLATGSKRDGHYVYQLRLEE